MTSARVAFYAGRGDDRLIDWPRGQVHANEQRRRFGGRRLGLSGPAGHVTLAGFESRRALVEVFSALRQPDLEV